MKTVEDIQKNKLASISSGHPVAKVSPNHSLSTEKRNTIELIDQLFLRLGAMYGHIWNNQFKDIALAELIKQEWFHALENMVPMQIQFALDVCLKEKMLPPSLPEFRKFCDAYQQHLKIPKVHDAYREAMLSFSVIHLYWSHPIVYHALCEVGEKRMRSALPEDSFQSYQVAYDRLVKSVMAGENYATPSQVIPTFSNPETARMHLKNLRKHLKGENHANH